MKVITSARLSEKTDTRHVRFGKIIGNFDLNISVPKISIYKMWIMLSPLTRASGRKVIPFLKHSSRNRITGHPLKEFILPATQESASCVHRAVLSSEQLPGAQDAPVQISY